jgi:trk system potassium uptake protein TrkA
VRLIVMGGGKVGGQIARDLDRAGHGVMVIEADTTRASALANSTDILVLHGDGTDLGLLSELGIRADDFFLALTGVDQDNLVACELVRVTFGVKRLLARLNDPKNGLTFKALDIPHVSVTDLLAGIITDRLELAELGQASLGREASMTFLTVLVPDDTETKRVHEIDLPPSTIIVALENEDGIRVPTGDSPVEPGDRVVVLTTIGSENDVAAALRGGST